MIIQRSERFDHLTAFIYNQFPGTLDPRSIPPLQASLSIWKLHLGSIWRPQFWAREDQEVQGLGIREVHNPLLTFLSFHCAGLSSNGSNNGRLCLVPDHSPTNVKMRVHVPENQNQGLISRT